MFYARKRVMDISYNASNTHNYRSSLIVAYCFFFVLLIIFTKSYRHE